MSTTFLAFIIIVPMIAVLTATVITFNKKLQGKSTGKAMKFNLLTFAVIAILVCSFTFFASAASDDTAAPAADTTAEETAQTAQTSSNGLGLLAAGLVTGLAGIGGGIAVAAGAPAAIAATSEDPKSFGKSLIFVALGESIALYGVVISILILNKV
ncbi:MAG: ATP synthase subunit C [Acutalibacteraceae bacterium]